MVSLAHTKDWPIRMGREGEELSSEYRIIVDLQLQPGCTGTNRFVLNKRCCSRPNSKLASWDWARIVESLVNLTDELTRLGRLAHERARLETGSLI